MLALATAIFGFLAPFLPELVKLARERQDAAHELKMLELRLSAASAEHAWRMEEVAARADIDEARALHRPAVSFGVQILDAARGHGLGGWALVPAFYLFALLDLLAGLVRPTITYAMVAFYVAYKWARLELMRAAMGPHYSAAEGVSALWGEQDWAVLTLVLSYWFGHRAMKAAFGGSAMTSAPAR